MARDVLYPADLGEGFDGAEIVMWHVSAGDHIVAGQPLLTAETATAVVEIPAPRGGHIGALWGSRGERMQAGAVLVEFAATSEDRGALVGDLPEPNQPNE